MTLKNRFTTVEASPVKIYLDYRRGTRKVSYNYPNELSTYHRARSYPAVVCYCCLETPRELLRLSVYASYSIDYVTGLVESHRNKLLALVETPRQPTELYVTQLV